MDASCPPLLYSQSLSNILLIYTLRYIRVFRCVYVDAKVIFTLLIFPVII